MTDCLARKISACFLPYVHNPAQYIGGEINQIKKTAHPGATRVALAFPDTYAIGSSHLGLTILYTALNRMDNVVAERVFCPWTDAADIMRRFSIPLFSWESRRLIREFDILGISLQHELALSNVLYLLDLAGITFRAEDRHETEPLVIGGGPLADSCEPVADFFDLVILGDGEESLPAVINAYRRLRREKAKRREILLHLAEEFAFVYVPRFYHCSYSGDGRLVACEPVEAAAAPRVQRALVQDLDGAVFPAAPIIPYTDTPHDRISIEIMRGCPQRCAFCHAGHTKGPVRYRSIEKILEIARQSYCATGYDTISLLSLSTGDYPQLMPLLQQLYREFAGRHVGISLPSLRVDKQLQEVPAQISDVRREGLTVAVETASGRIRQAIGKHITDENLMASMQAAFAAGWRKVKLYFMLGFPGETEDDIMGIYDLACRISDLRRETAGGPAAVNVAISWLVPKPHTPFQWLGQRQVEYFHRAKELLIDRIKFSSKKPLTLKFHHMERSILEGVLSRGDRRLGKVLESAYSQGARFDCWNECFDYERYRQAFRQCGVDPDFYAHRRRQGDEVLPWDHLAGDNREQLWQRYQRIMQMLGERTPG